jgi:hypothetical protein
MFVIRILFDSWATALKEFTGKIPLPFLIESFRFLYILYFPANASKFCSNLIFNSLSWFKNPISIT